MLHIKYKSVKKSGGHRSVGKEWGLGGMLGVGRDRGGEGDTGKEKVRKSKGRRGGGN